MNFKKLFEMQFTLDEKITDYHELDGYTLMDERILALLVEAGELANEVRSFKFWSGKGQSDDDVVLMELVDNIHFLLSIGNYRESDFIMAEAIINDELKGNLNHLFIAYYKAINEYREVPNSHNYLTMWDYIMTIGSRLGFTGHDIYNGYFVKNIENHYRQESGY